MGGGKQLGVGRNSIAGSSGGGRLCNLFSIARLHVGNPFWSVVLHFCGMGLIEPTRLCMMCGMWYAWRS